MTTKKIKDTALQISNAIHKNKIALALSYIKDLINQDNNWELTSKYDEIIMLYKQHLSYNIKGTKLEDNTEMCDFIRNNILEVSEKLCHNIETKISKSFSATLRKSQDTAHAITPTAKNIFSVQEQYNNGYSDEFHTEANTLFNVLAFSDNISGELKANISDLIADKNIIPLIKLISISAISLNILTVYNSELFNLLLKSYQIELNNELKARIDIALVLIIAKYNDRITLDKKNFSIISDLLTDKSFLENIEYTYTQIVRTYENKSISKKIENEILPEMMKIKSKDIFKIEIDDDDDFNPKWNDAIENPQLEEKLREFGDLQLSGADVYVSTFAQLKSHPFFFNIANWFFPFDGKNKFVSKLFNNNDDFFTILSKSPQLCNSDKYSFFMTIADMPQSQINMLTTSIADQISQMKEENIDEAWKENSLEYKHTIRQHIQDLYRFYNLFAHKAEFNSPLETALDLYKHNIYNILFPNSESKLRIAEFFFEKDCYANATDLFLNLSSEIIPEADFYQKLGYAAFKSGNTEVAISAYNDALLIQPNDKWTINALVRTHKSIGNIHECVSLLENLHKLYNDDTKIITNLANSYYEIGDFQSSLKLLFKINYLEPNNINTIRKIIDVLLRTNNIEKTAYYINIFNNMIPDISALNSNDLINIAYFDITNGNNTSAINHLKKLFSLLNNDIVKFYDTAINEKLITDLKINLDYVKSLCEAVIIIDDL